MSIGGKDERTIGFFDKIKKAISDGSKKTKELISEGIEEAKEKASEIKEEFKDDIKEAKRRGEKAIDALRGKSE